MCLSRRLDLGRGFTSAALRNRLIDWKRPPDLLPKMKAIGGDVATTTRYAVRQLTRVEGEGSLHLLVRDGRVAEARLQIFEAPRYFEALVVGLEGVHAESLIQLGSRNDEDLSQSAALVAQIGKSSTINSHSSSSPVNPSGAVAVQATGITYSTPTSRRPFSTGM